MVYIYTLIGGIYIPFEDFDAYARKTTQHDVLRYQYAVKLIDNLHHATTIFNALPADPTEVRSACHVFGLYMASIRKHASYPLRLPAGVYMSQSVTNRHLLKYYSAGLVCDLYAYIYCYYYFLRYRTPHSEER